MVKHGGDMLKRAKYSDILNENLVQSAQDFRTGPSNRTITTYPNYIAKTMQEWLRDNSVDVL